MAGYSFEIRRAERLLHAVEGVSLAAPHDAWDVIEALARQFDAPGLRIVVKDEAGGVVIMAGLTRARNALEREAA